MQAAGVAGIVAELREEIAACRLCPGMKPWKKRPPDNHGATSTGYMLVGPTPGGFRVLREVLKEIGADLEESFYLAEAARCRPSRPRSPSVTECKTCRPFLQFEIRALRPRLVITLGARAAESVLGRPVKLEREHGQRHRLRDVEVLTLMLPSPGNRAALRRVGLTLQGYRRRLVELFGELVHPVRDEDVGFVRL